MAVVVYTCDTCRRTIEIPQNPSGLEVMSHCIITDGCKGNLIQQAVKMEYIQGKLPAPDPTGLTDWIPRRVYYKLEQPVSLRVWKVPHNLGTKPSVQVYLYDAGGVLITTPSTEVATSPGDSLQYMLKYIDLFNVEITFADPQSGVVQCFARTTITDEKREQILTQSVTTAPMTSITGGGVLSLAIPLSGFDPTRIRIGFISAYDTKITGPTALIFTENSGSYTTSTLSPWSNTGDLQTRVFFSGKPWNVITANVADDIVLSTDVPDGSPFFFTYTKTYDIDPTKTTYVVNSTNTITTSITTSSTIEVGVLAKDVVRDMNGVEYPFISSIINNDGSTTFNFTSPAPLFQGQSSVDLDMPVNSSTVYVLLSTSPFLQYDRDYNHVVDVGQLSYTATVSRNFNQIADVLYCSETIEQVVYPSIIVV